MKTLILLIALFVYLILAQLPEEFEGMPKETSCSNFAGEFALYSQNAENQAILFEAGIRISRPMLDFALTQIPQIRPHLPELKDLNRGDQVHIVYRNGSVNVNLGGNVKESNISQEEWTRAFQAARDACSNV